MYIPYIHLEIKCALCECLLYAESTRGVGWATDEHVMQHLRIKEAKVFEDGNALCKDCKDEYVDW